MNQPTDLPGVLQYIANEQRQRAASELATAQQKLVATSYDKAAAYTTVIVFGGYAGFFALWQLSKEYLSREQTLWSALLILVSLLSFVLFEVVKMVLVTRDLIRRAGALDLPGIRNDLPRLLAVLTELDQGQIAARRPFMIIWAFTVAIALAGAIGAAGILGYAFIDGLAK